MEQIYEKYYKSVYRYLYALTNNYDISEELTQETFYSAIKKIDTFRNECSIYSWLCQIAKNKWKNYQIRNSKIQIIQYDENIENWLTKDYIEDSIERIDIYKKIQCLDLTTKEIINLRIMAGLTFKEIGEVLNKNENLVRITFYRAKLKLKQSIDKNENIRNLEG